VLSFLDGLSSQEEEKAISEPIEALEEEKDPTIEDEESIEGSFGPC
jgi:hypothetical protein